VRYPRELRDSVGKLQALPVVTDAGAQIALASVAKIRISEGPASLKSENARLTGWIYVDVRGRDLAAVVGDAKRAVETAVRLPPGMAIQWSGQYEYLVRATERLAVVVPFTVAIIFVLLYLAFRRVDEAALIMVTVPFALVGGFWYVWLLGHHLSVASAVGFIALAGLAAEFGVVMLIYLKQALARHAGPDGAPDENALREAIDEGAVLRVRPKAMTVAVILAGLAPIMWSEGAGAEIMQRIAAPMIGGMITAPLLSMFVIPAAYLLMRRRRAEPLPAPVSSAVS
jgi:Cu(I)/Ag(I) efflux system membrane protein CusA/SilA